MTRSEDRWQSISRALTTRRGGELSPTSMCVVAAELLNVEGAGIMLTETDGMPSAFYASDLDYGLLQQTQFTIGVGPAIEAYTSGSEVAEEDLANHPPQRWFGYVLAALEVGVRAVFAFPLVTDQASLGAFTLYRHHRGALSSAEHEDALTVSEVITFLLLATQARAGAGLSEELASESLDLAEVHQAAGMISSQLGITARSALTRLRAWAFANSMSISDAAQLVVSRRLVLER